MITVDYPNSTIFIPKAFSTFIQSTPSEIRRLDTELVWTALRDLEDSEDGRAWPRLVDYTAPKTLDGIGYAPFIEIREPYFVTFEDGLYRVIFDGSNNNLLSRATVNSVSLAPQNSAGQTYSKQIEDQSFVDGRVYVDTITGSPGTVFPRGTQGDPVDSIEDAKGIIATRSLGRRVYFIGSITLPNGEDLSRFNMKGDFYANSILNLQEGSNSDQMVAQNMYISGGHHGSNCQYVDCLLLNSVNLSGYMLRCKVGGTLQISTSSDFVGCYGTAVIAPVQPDLSINIVNFSGNVTVANMIDPDTSVSVGILSGVVTIDASCVAGTITVVDADHLVDNSGPNCTVIAINQHLVTQAELASVGGLTDEIHKIHGLDPSNPLSVTATTRDVAGISQTISGDGETNSTVTRT